MLRLRTFLVGLMVVFVGTFAFAAGEQEVEEVDLQIGIAPREVGDTFPEKIAEFEEQNPQVNVDWLEVPGVPGEQKSLYVTNLVGASDEPDIMALDVIWPGEFIANNWTIPLNDYFTDEELADFNPALLDAATVNGEVHAIPYYQNAIHFFYRRDLLDDYGLDVPTTWAELEEKADIILEGEDDPDMVGYSSMWAEIEGLFMNYLQFLWGAGGQIVDDAGNIVIDTPEGEQALEQMVGMLERGTAPDSLLTYDPNDAQTVFRQGRTPFLVVQGFVWDLLTADDSPVADVVEMGSVPVFDGVDPETTPRHATGAWMFAINPHSEHPDEAAELIRYLTTEENQVRLAIETGNLPPRVGMEDHEELLAEKPIAEQQFKNFNLGNVRPSMEAGEDYSELSSIMQRYIHGALLGEMEVDEALQSAQEEADALLGQ